MKGLFYIFFKSNNFVFLYSVDKSMTVDHKNYRENCLKFLLIKYVKFGKNLPHTH